MTFIPHSTRLAIDEAVSASVKSDRDLLVAAKKCQPYLGEINLDQFTDASKIYELLFDQLCIDYADVDPSAYSAMADLLTPSFVASAEEAMDRKLAADSARQKSFAERFPTAGKLKRTF